MLSLSALEPRDEVAVHIKPDDQDRAQEAQRYDAKEHAAAYALRRQRLGAGLADVAAGGSDETIDRGRQSLRQVAVLGQESLRRQQ